MSPHWTGTSSVKVVARMPRMMAVSVSVLPWGSCQRHAHHHTCSRETGGQGGAPLRVTEALPMVGVLPERPQHNRT